MYYPNEDGVDKDTSIKQSVDQLLSREGSWHSCVNPYPPSGLSRAFSIMCNDKTWEMVSFDPGDKEGGNMENEGEL